MFNVISFRQLRHILYAIKPLKWKTPHGYRICLLFSGKSIQIYGCWGLKKDLLNKDVHQGCFTAFAIGVINWEMEFQ